MYFGLFEGFTLFVHRNPPRTGFRLIIATINNNHINLETFPAKVLFFFLIWRFIYLNSVYLHLDRLNILFILNFFLRKNNLSCILLTELCVLKVLGIVSKLNCWNLFNFWEFVICIATFHKMLSHWGIHIFIIKKYKIFFVTVSIHLCFQHSDKFYKNYFY